MLYAINPTIITVTVGPTKTKPEKPILLAGLTVPIAGTLSGLALIPKAAPAVKTLATIGLAVYGGTKAAKVVGLEPTATIAGILI